MFYFRMRTIALTTGELATIDDEDFDLVSRFRWRSAFTLDKSGEKRWIYACHSKKTSGRVICTFLHKLIMNPPEGMVVDHINHNTLDNRRCNLRICTKSQNQQNRKKLDHKRFKGTRRHGPGWVAQISVKGKKLFLGYFTTEEDAARAYDKAAMCYFGEFCWINFPLRELDRTAII